MAVVYIFSKGHNTWHTRQEIEEFFSLTTYWPMHAFSDISI
mgnify:CR=1 FL=1